MCVCVSVCYTIWKDIKLRPRFNHLRASACFKTKLFLNVQCSDVYQFIIVFIALVLHSRDAFELIRTFLVALNKNVNSRINSCILCSSFCSFCYASVKYGQIHLRIILSSVFTFVDFLHDSEKEKKMKFTSECMPYLYALTVRSTTRCSWDKGREDRQGEICSCF